MRRPEGVISWLPLGSCSPPASRLTLEDSQPDSTPRAWIGSQPGDIQVAQTHLRDFGFDPGPMMASIRPRAKAAYELTRLIMDSRCRDCSICRRASS